MTKRDRESYLRLHVPRRLHAVDAMRWACEVHSQGNLARTIRMRNPEPGMRPSNLTLQPFVVPLIELGAVNCAGLLQFLGLRWDFDYRKGARK